jgi:ABC-2 type transport system permease protein
MQVYKAYFKIIKNNLASIAIYIIIFLLMAVLITNILGAQGGTAAFSPAKTSVAFFSGESTPLTDGLKAYLDQNANMVSIPDETQEIQDALFFGQVTCMLRVPQGFTQAFLAGGGDTRIEKTAAAGRPEAVYADLLVNKYLNTAALYVQNMPGVTLSEIAQYVSRDLVKQASVEVNTYEKPAAINNMSYYFQYLAYSIMATMILAITSVMMAFNQADVSNRNACCPVKTSVMNLQLLLGNITFAVIFWAGMCTFVFLLNRDAALDAGTVLLCLNAFVFTFASLSIGFLLGHFIKSQGVQGAIMNVIALGLSFLSGVFIPQGMLGASVLNAASFTPSYWYIKAVEDIRSITAFDFQTALPVLYSILIQAGFAAAIMIVSLVISKQKKLANAYN